MTTSKLCDGWQARKVGPAGPTDPAYSRSAKPSPLGEGRLHAEGAEAAEEILQTVIHW